MQSFRDLLVWNKAHAVVLGVYAATRSFPTSERYGLQGQLRRSASSIASNLAEGCGRNTAGSFATFVEIAFASASESEYQLLLSRDLGLLEEGAYQSLCRDIVEVKKMLAKLHKTLEARAARHRRS